MLLVQFYWNHNSGKLSSTLMSLASLNARLDALEEHIMGSFLFSPETRNTIAVGFLDPYGLPSASIHGVTIHSNIDHSIAYKISKLRLLQYRYYWNLTHMEYWEMIDLTSIKWARDTTTVYMVHFIAKCMSNTSPIITLLQQRLHATTNLLPHCGLSLDKIQHMY